MIGTTMPMGPLRILIIDDEANSRTALAICLKANGQTVVAHGNMQEAMVAASWHAFDLIFLDLRLGTDNGLDCVYRLLAESPWAKIVVTMGCASANAVVKAMKLGATDYLVKPFTAEQIQWVTNKVAERRLLERQVEALRSSLDKLDPEADLPTASAAMTRTLEMARQVANSNATILICGETGTGKGRLARAIHAWSPCRRGPFATGFCRTMAAEVLDAELFGLSATDVSRVPAPCGGLVELCTDGTLLLDEIGDAPPSIQPKLLRLMHEKEYERYDDFKVRQSNARVVATASNDLQACVRRGRFRQDLLGALEVVRIDMPPLRQRREDIRLLAQRYLAFYSREHHRTITGFTRGAWDVLARHSWPGNVRELRNIIERAVLFCNAEQIGREHLPGNLLRSPGSRAVGDWVPLDTIGRMDRRGDDAAASVGLRKKLVAGTP